MAGKKRTSLMLLLSVRNMDILNINRYLNFNTQLSSGIIRKVLNQKLNSLFRIHPLGFKFIFETFRQTMIFEIIEPIARILFSQKLGQTEIDLQLLTEHSRTKVESTINTLYLWRTENIILQQLSTFSFNCADIKLVRMNYLVRNVAWTHIEDIQNNDIHTYIHTYTHTYIYRSFL